MNRDELFLNLRLAKNLMSGSGYPHLAESCDIAETYIRRLCDERDELTDKIDVAARALKPFADESKVGPMPGKSDDPRECSLVFLKKAKKALDTLQG